MTTLQLSLDDEVIALLRESNRPADQAAREMVVLELYRRGSISSGKAAQLLGLSREELILLAGRMGIAHFDMTADEWAAERSQSEAL
jgi:predicted HTH domain antitoxin